MELTTETQRVPIRSKNTQNSKSKQNSLRLRTNNVKWQVMINLIQQKKKIVMINLTSFSLHTSHNSQQQFPVQQIDEFIHVMQCKANASQNSAQEYGSFNKFWSSGSLKPLNKTHQFMLQNWWVHLRDILSSTTKMKSMKSLWKANRRNF